MADAKHGPSMSCRRAGPAAFGLDDAFEQTSRRTVGSLPSLQTQEVDETQDRTDGLRIKEDEGDEIEGAVSGHSMSLSTRGGDSPVEKAVVRGRPW